MVPHPHLPPPLCFGAAILFLSLTGRDGREATGEGHALISGYIREPSVKTLGYSDDRRVARLSIQSPNCFVRRCLNSARNSTSSTAFAASLALSAGKFALA